MIKTNSSYLRCASLSVLRQIDHCCRSKMGNVISSSTQAESGTFTENLMCDGANANSSCTRASKGSLAKFQDMKRFEDFKVYVDGQLLDSELTEHAKLMYYELCVSQKMFLHDGLIEGLGSELVAGMISKTSDIACAIRNTRLAGSLHDLDCWDKTLRAFENLGMTVGFLLARIPRVRQAVYESWNEKVTQVEERKRELDAKISRMNKLAKSIATIKASIQSVEAEIDALFVWDQIEDLETVFSIVAASPWSDRISQLRTRLSFQNRHF